MNDYGVNYFLKGNLKRIQNRNYMSVQSNRNNIDEYSFNPKDGDTQFFLPNTLFKKIFIDFSTTQKISFSLNESNWTPELNFLLNIDYLGKVVPEIYKYKVRDEKIQVKGIFDELEFNTETRNLNCKILFKINDSKEKTILSWKTDIQFRFNVIINFEESSINYIIGEINVSDITFTQNDFGEADIQTLIGWIEDSFSLMIIKNKFSLFKKNINLKKYIQINETKDITNKGILLIS